MKNPEDIMTVESMIRTEKAFWKDIRSIHGPRRVFAQGGSHGPRLLTHVARDRPPGTLALQGVAGGRAGGRAGGGLGGSGGWGIWVGCAGDVVVKFMGWVVNILSLLLLFD